MRTYKVKVGDREIECALTFTAHMLITDRVMDPMQIARDEALMQQAMKAGRDYKGDFSMTTLNLVKIIHAGHEAFGGKLTLEEIGGMVIDAGPVNVLEPVGGYLAALVGGELQEVPTGKKQKGSAGKRGAKVAGA